MDTGLDFWCHVSAAKTTGGSGRLWHATGQRKIALNKPLPFVERSYVAGQPALSKRIPFVVSPSLPEIPFGQREFVVSFVVSLSTMNGILPDSTPFSSGKERYLSRMTGRFPGLPFGPTLRACSLRHPAYAVRCAAYWLRCSNPFVASPQIPSVVNPSIPFVVSPSIPFVVNPSIPFVVNPSIPFVVSLSNHERNHGGAYSSSNRPKNRGCGQLYPSNPHPPRTRRVRPFRKLRSI
jgi:hypothetical protein